MRKKVCVNIAVVNSAAWIRPDSVRRMDGVQCVTMPKIILGDNYNEFHEPEVFFEMHERSAS